MDYNTFMTLFLIIGIPVFLVLVLLPAVKKKNADKSDKDDE